MECFGKLFVLLGIFCLSAEASRRSSNSIRCGRRPRRSMFRIVGGSAATPHSWPWMVSINTQNTPSSSNIGRRNGHSCGGVILAEQWVLTAAHCLDNKSNSNQFPDNPPSHWFITAGMHMRDVTSPSSRRWQQRGVKRYFYHERFRDLKVAAYNDVALLELDRPLRFNYYVRPICLPGGRATPPGQDRCYAAGWGTTAEGSDRYSIPLRQVQIPIINSIFCRVSYPKQYNSHQHLCGGNWFKGGKDSCKGDSGGPLACFSEDGFWYVAGIVSWGIGCGGRRAPGVYTNVRTYEHWILKTLFRYSPQSVYTYYTSISRGR